MPPRKKPRVGNAGTGIALHPSPSSVISNTSSYQASPGPSQPRKKRRRREASVLRESRLADEVLGDAGDLVPPSDEDEYEIWLSRWARRAVQPSPGVPSDDEISSKGLDDEEDVLKDMKEMEVFELDPSQVGFLWLCWIYFTIKGCWS